MKGIMQVWMSFYLEIVDVEPDVNQFVVEHILEDASVSVGG